MIKVFLFVLVALTTLVHAQDQSGFISLDCGLPDNSSYTDDKTGIHYVSDGEFIDTGVSETISPYYKTNVLYKQYLNLRSFADGIKNCYTLTPPFVNGTKYMVRATFMHGNYDNQYKMPSFDLYVGVNYWESVVINNYSVAYTKEILHIPLSNYTDVCLVNTGFGTPFISVLELRLVRDDIYVSPFGSLSLSRRFDVRAYANSDIIRFENDTFDRIWAPSFFTNETIELNTSYSIYQNKFELPYAVMNTAITPQYAFNDLIANFRAIDPSTKFYIYMHFVDFQSKGVREFDIHLNGKLWYGPLRPKYLSTTTIYSGVWETPGTWLNFSFTKTSNSTLPPILNAMELYRLRELKNPQTYQVDVDAMKSIKVAYGVKKNWQGDPCSPPAFTWEGLGCFNNRIISLNMSYSRLAGEISPSIFNLTMLQYLDMSNNTLTGKVPNFLSQMKNLDVLNLSGNNLTGSIPAELLNRSKSGSLKLSVEGNPMLCANGSCEILPEKKEEEKKKNSNIKIVIIVASVATVSVALNALAIYFIVARRNTTVTSSSPDRA